MWQADYLKIRNRKIFPNNYNKCESEFFFLFYFYLVDFKSLQKRILEMMQYRAEQIR